MKILATISTKNRYDILFNAIISVALQTKRPNKLIIFDDNENPVDLRNLSIYQYAFNLLNEKKIEWEVIYGEKKGQHHNHQKANKMGYDLVWRIDDDEFAENNVLETLYNLIDDNVGAVGGLILMPGYNWAKTQNTNINDIRYNVQWHKFNGVKEIEHLNSSFLYRAGIIDYNLNLSKVAHTEETQFTYELFKRGYKILATGDCITWHFRQPTGGIRSEIDNNLWKNDEDIFRIWLNWGKLIILDNGLGDHFAFKKILPEIQKKFNKITISCCYPEVFSGIKGLNLISINEAKGIIPIENYNIYKFMRDNNWNKPIIEAYKKLYL